VACARQLAKTLKAWHPHAQVCLLTDSPFEDSVFDYVQLLPNGDRDKDGHWKLSNDWQVFSASPFRQTIKLEADMIVASPIDHWWPLFENRDVVISTGCRNFYDNPGTSRYYRKIFDNNQLPDVYNAITYWRVSQHARDFFILVKQIFENWDSYKTLLKFPDNNPTTDVVYAIAASIIGVETCTLPPDLGPSIVHMKRHIIPTQGYDWTKELVWENTNPGLRINTVAQFGLVHYHVKDWRAV
jgi:hypothetical protein